MLEYIILVILIFILYKLVMKFYKKIKSDFYRDRFHVNLKNKGIKLDFTKDVYLHFNFQILKPTMFLIEDIIVENQLESVLDNFNISTTGDKTCNIYINNKYIQMPFYISIEELFRKNLEQVDFIWNFKITILDNSYPSINASTIYEILDHIIQHNNYYIYYDLVRSK